MSGLMLLGYALVILGSLWLIVMAFQTSLGWGVGTLIIPFVSLIFAVAHWDDAKVPLIMQVVGIGLVIWGAPTGMEGVELGEY